MLCNISFNSLPTYQPTYLPTYLPAYLPTYLPTYHFHRNILLQIQYDIPTVWVLRNF